MNIKLNEEQIAFVRSKKNSITLSARPGSGKTASLMARIQHDQESGIHPDGQTVVTKTVAAATEMKSRLDGDKPAFIGTIHALGLEIMQLYGSTLGYKEGDIEVITEEESREIMADMAAKVGADKNSSWRYVGEWSPKTAAGVAAVAHLRILRSRNQTDFPCMLAEATRIANNHSLNYSNLYVDEYQDTTTKEAELLRALNPSTSVIVGDEDQAIMGWDEPLDSFYSWSGSIMSLKRNHRSGNFIVEAANRLASRFTHYRPGAIPMEAVDRARQYLTYHSQTADDTEACSLAINLASQDLSRGQTVAILTRHNHLANRIITMAGSSLGELMPKIDYISSAERRNVQAVIEEFVKAGSWSQSELRTVGLTNRERRMVEVAVHRAGGMNKHTILALNEQDTEKRQCHIGTVHSFKGREADVVYLVGAENHRFEKARGDNNEERKIFYVALTRARKVFHTISSKMVYVEGKGDVHAEPSVFIKEMGEA